MGPVHGRQWTISSASTIVLSGMTRSGEKTFFPSIRAVGYDGYARTATSDEARKRKNRRNQLVFPLPRFLASSLRPSPVCLKKSFHDTLVSMNFISEILGPETIFSGIKRADHGKTVITRQLPQVCFNLNCYTIFWVIQAGLVHVGMKGRQQHHNRHTMGLQIV